MKTNFNQRRGRIITVNNKKWKVYIGKYNTIAYSETGERKCDKNWVIKGVTPDIFERGQWKKTSDGMVLPSEIEKWLFYKKNS